MLLFRSKKPTAWGLDIGERSLKLIAVVPYQNNYHITNINRVALTDDETARGIEKDPQLLGKKIKKLVAEAQGKKIKTRFVHACIPDTETFVKLIDIPDMTDEEIPEAVKWASEQHIPLAAEDMHLDWHVIRRDPQTKKIFVLLGAVQKETSNHYTASIKAAGLIPLSLDVEATAIARGLQTLAKQNTKNAAAFLDLGATHSSLIIYAGSTIQFVSSIPFSGNATTEKLAKELKISPAEAEKAKQICGVNNPDCEDAILKILRDDFDAMIEKIKQAFSYYNKNTDQALPIEALYLCGGGAYLPGISDMIAKACNATTNLAHLSKGLIINPPQLYKEKELVFITSLGLALKAYE